MRHYRLYLSVQLFEDGVINEGDSFSFIVQSTPAPMNPIMVQISADDNGSGHFAEFSIANPVEIGIDGETEVTVTTNVDVDNNVHGLIEISIDQVVSEHYIVASQASERAFTSRLKIVLHRPFLYLLHKVPLELLRAKDFRLNLDQTQHRLRH